MKTFNPMMYFKSAPAASASASATDEEGEQPAPVEYIIRTRSQTASRLQQEQQEQAAQEQEEEQEQTKDMSPRHAAAAAAAASYKSIIRTRSQKLAEHRAFTTKMFADINAYYETHKREPTEDQAMASFLKSLREAHAADKLGGQSSVDMVHAHLPWFKFEESSSSSSNRWSSRSHMVVTLAGLFTLCLYLSLMVSVLHVLDVCSNNGPCPEWVLEAGDALTMVENQLQYSLNNFTAPMQWKRAD